MFAVHRETPPAAVERSFIMAIVKPLRNVNMAETAAEYARRGVGGDPFTYT